MEIQNFPAQFNIIMEKLHTLVEQLTKCHLPGLYLHALCNYYYLVDDFTGVAPYQ